MPQLARQVLELLAAQLDEVAQRIAEVDARIMAWHKTNPVSRRLVTIPGIGPLIATAIAATVPDPDVFRGGREFAAWLGLVPRQRSTGGKQRLGRISRLGDKYIRQLLIVGAQTVLLRSKAARVQCVDPSPAGQTTPPRGRRCSREQDGPRRLGGDGQGAELSAGGPGIGRARLSR